ncbi:MAG: 4-alpha-glucanotransferase [Candidatus Zixiibacteriota bacterium]
MGIIKRKQDRFCGILLHPSSLPGNSGIGDIGKQAYKFVDFLHESEQSLWQILPLGITGYGNSPYQSYSAFAGNHLLISLDWLYQEGLLTPFELESFPRGNPSKVDFDLVNREKLHLLKESLKRFKEKASVELKERYQVFKKKNRKWLQDYSLFMAILEANDYRLWNTWPEELVHREKEALSKARNEYASQIEFHKLAQFVFYHQWNLLKRYANDKGIKIIGDIPIFVALNSADVWANPEKFYLDDKGNPTVVAGVPPDYFSKTGQLWGNPLYNWKKMKKAHYSWWINRIRAMLELVDIIRIDHFRGFAAYWEVPAGEKTAMNGRWVKGPGHDFFAALQRKLGHEGQKLPLIAEDLGVITEDVEELRDDFHLPGMKILQFAFGGRAQNAYLPHNHIENCFVYTGTHDNNTTLGWYQKAAEKEKDHVRRYFNCSDDRAPLEIMRAAWGSNARWAVVPLQDVIGLDSSGRMNVPGTAKGNWQWRFQWDLIKQSHIAMLKYHADLYGRTSYEVEEKFADGKTPDPRKAVEPD